MSDSSTVLAATPQRIGVAADHGGFESKEYLVRMLREADYQVVDFGGGHVVGNAVAWELVRTFLQARFTGAERHRRRFAKVASLESTEEIS